MKRQTTQHFDTKVKKSKFIRDDISVSGSASSDETSDSGSQSDSFFVRDHDSELSSTLSMRVHPRAEREDFSQTSASLEQESEKTQATGSVEEETHVDPTPIFLTQLEQSTREKPVKAGAMWSARSKEYFLTFPQNGMDHKKLYSTILLNQAGKIKDLIVGKETHASGDPHLHVVLVFHQRVLLTAKVIESWFPHAHRKHGNYKVVRPGLRNLAFTYAYCGKEGVFEEFRKGKYEELRKLADSFLVKGDKAERAAQSKKEILEITKILGTCTPKNRHEVVRHVMDNFPGRQFMFMKRVQELSSYWAAENSRCEPQNKWLGLELNEEWINTASMDELLVAQKIIDWFNENIKDEARPIRKQQLYICGPPRSGKSTFAENLRKHLKVFAWPRRETFVDGWVDFAYDLVTFDEFNGGMCLHDLLALLDGSTYKIPQKGLAAVDKSHNIPMLMMSNKLAEVIYAKAFEGSPEISGTLSGPNGRLMEVVLPPGMRLDVAIKISMPPITMAQEIDY